MINQGTHNTAYGLIAGPFSFSLIAALSRDLLNERGSSPRSGDGVPPARNDGSSAMRL